MIFPSGAALPDSDFDPNRDLEGQLLRLGMKFDEVHEKVDTNLAEKSIHRQPFQTNRLSEQEDSNNRNEETKMVK